jgi:DNA-binding MarR family transcriptional regulator
VTGAKSVKTTVREKHDGHLGGPKSVGLWLRLLSCSMVVEKRLRRRFEALHGTTLPRFDVMAALDRSPEGLTMGELSRKLLVSNGNVTGLVRQLESQGLVSAAAAANDRRASIVALTNEGRTVFADLAKSHHAWLKAMLSGLPPDRQKLLFELLGELRASISAEETEEV